MFNQSMIMGLVRHALTLVGGYLAAKGYLDPESAETIVGAVFTLIGAGWSIQAKKA